MNEIGFLSFLSKCAGRDLSKGINFDFPGFCFIRSREYFASFETLNSSLIVRSHVIDETLRE